jgi:hypothetical protein
VVETINLIIELDNISLFAQGLDILADMSFQAGDINNAFHAYHKMVKPFLLHF